MPAGIWMRGAEAGHVSPNRTRRVSCSWPVGRVSDSYRSGRRALSQRLPDDVHPIPSFKRALQHVIPSAAGARDLLYTIPQSRSFATRASRALRSEPALSEAKG